jgi:DNA-binding transcriptional regulator YhcF (GntR family)
MDMKTRSELLQYLRDHIVGGLHVGQLHSGDRLPSIRELAEQLRKNPRTVKAAYAALEQERLVEVRGRSGVFVARQGVLAGEMPAEMARWLSGVLAEAWQRRIALPALPQLVKRATCTSRVRCVLVEEVEDTIVAVRHELVADWGFDVRVVAPDSLADAGDVDFFAATSFCAPIVHNEVEALGKPLVVLTIHPALQEAISSRLREGRLTVVAVDARFGERMRIAYAATEAARNNFRVVLTDDRAAIARLDPDEPVLLTRAARERLPVLRVKMIYPHSPTLSMETARALASIVVRKNLNANSE